MKFFSSGVWIFRHLATITLKVRARREKYMAPARPARPGIEGETMAKSPRAAYRPTGWPVLRTPKGRRAAAGVLVAGLVLVAVPHRPSARQRAADLRGMVHALPIDIEACAGGVTDSLSALRAIESGTSHDVKTAVTIANTATAKCSPGNNMMMDDLRQFP